MIVETLYSTIGVLRSPEVWGMTALALGAAILKVRKPDSITMVKTKRGGGRGVGGLAVRVTTHDADYLFIPTAGVVRCELNDGQHGVSIVDRDAPFKDVQINTGGRTVFQTRETKSKLTEVPNLPNTSILYMGHVDNEQAYLAFLRAVELARR